MNWVFTRDGPCRWVTPISCRDLPSPSPGVMVRIEDLARPKGATVSVPPSSACRCRCGMHLTLGHGRIAKRRCPAGRDYALRVHGSVSIDVTPAMIESHAKAGFAMIRRRLAADGDSLAPSSIWRAIGGFRTLAARGRPRCLGRCAARFERHRASRRLVDGAWYRLHALRRHGRDADGAADPP